MDANAIDLFHDNRVKPTIDKVTLCGHSTEDILQDDIELLVWKNGENKYMCEHYESNRFMSFARLIKISYKHFYDNGSHEVYTLVVMIGFNGMNMCGSYEEQHKFQIEFNPNKFIIPDWLINYFSTRGYIVDLIKNIDLAFDFVGFPKRDFRYVLNSANTKTASIGTQNNKTDYIGFSDKSNNRIKIYDKKKERAPYYHMDMETTRLEITLQYRHIPTINKIQGEDSKHIESACNAVRQVFIADDIATDPLVYALSCLDNDQLSTAFSLMSKNVRTKYKKLLKNRGGFKFCCEFVDMSFFLLEELEKIIKDNLFCIA